MIFIISSNHESYYYTMEHSSQCHTVIQGSAGSMAFDAMG